MYLPFILVPERDVHAQVILYQFLALLESIPIVRKICIETAELPSQKDRSCQKHHISGECGQQKHASIPQKSRCHEYDQSGYQSNENVSPAGVFRISGTYHE